MRHEGIDAQTLEGGFEAWRAAKELLVRPDKLPARDEKGRTVWVTRARPKIDRIACPWLIRRFVDPGAVFLFVAPSEVRGRRRALQGDTVRHRRRVLEPSWRDLHLRRHDRGVRAQVGSAAAAGRASCAAPTRPRSTWRRSRRACSRRHSATRACSATISSSSRPPCRSTMPSIAGAGTPAPRRTTGLPPRLRLRQRMMDTTMAARAGSGSAPQPTFAEALQSGPGSGSSASAGRPGRSR